MESFIVLIGGPEFIRMGQSHSLMWGNMVCSQEMEPGKSLSSVERFQLQKEKACLTALQGDLESETAGKKPTEELNEVAASQKLERFVGFSSSGSFHYCDQFS
ncbi:hypothetical protein C5167_011852 [Papaver somniferum]|uniref:Uncharacterized protein n=1 Tax=Papaver somniferum TaxID=3469 RepID=A0A4Y7J011_PAPSO|nr:hypothetical protein C5167_011852 [Papaver somniferum]